jgi:hypothetical protein
VSVEFPDGNEIDPGDKIKIVYVARDPSGVKRFEWGIFTQNLTSLKGGTKNCDNATECRHEVKEEVPIEGIFIAGADAVSTSGQTTRGIGEFYVR